MALPAVIGRPITIGRTRVAPSVLLILPLLLLVFLVGRSSQLLVSHRLRSVVDGVNRNGPFVGVVMAYKEEADSIASSGDFVPLSDVPWVDLYGRRFHIGSIHGVPVMYVMSGQRRLNAGITVQILLDYFDIRGIVHYGTAGSTDDSLSFADVSVPKFVAFTGSWDWMKFKSGKVEEPELNIGAYNIPKKGENLLSRIEFKPEEFFPVGGSMQEVFWLETYPAWFRIAQQLKHLELEKCANATYCLCKRPKVVFGLKGSTSDIFVDNAAYRKFLFKEFNVSTVDEESAAIVMTAMSPGVPVIVFRGVSDLAGREATGSLSSLASANALKVAVEFIKVIGSKKHFL